MNGKLTEALAEVEAAIEMQPGQAPPVAMKTGILYLQKRYDEAISAGRKALAYQPNFPTALNWLYRLYGQQKNYADAVALLSSARRYFTGASADQEYVWTSQWQDLVSRRGIGPWVQDRLEHEFGPPIQNMMRYEHATWRM